MAGIEGVFLWDDRTGECKHVPPVINIEEDRLKDIEKALEGVHKGITYDEAAGVVRIGKWQSAGYKHYKSAHKFLAEIMDSNDLPYSYHPKWFNKAAAILLGGSPKQNYAFFKSLQYKYFVAPYSDILTKICYIPGMICEPALKRIAATHSICRPVFEDGLHNILPIVVATGKSPQELRKELGKGVWKTLANNSLNKNKNIVLNVNADVRAHYSADERTIAMRAELPSTVLKAFRGHSLSMLEHVSKHYRGQWTSKKSPQPKLADLVSGRAKLEPKRPNWASISNTVNDTKWMADKLNAPFDAEWTPRKMQERHDQYAKEIMKLKHSPDPIEWLNKICPRFEYAGYTATLLNNRLAIAEEGQVMGHCVGSYAESVANGSYLVYSVTDADGQRSSTIGITVLTDSGVDMTVGGKVMYSKGPKIYRFNQHYGRFNKHLTCGHEIKLSELLIKQLNDNTKELSV